MPLPLPPASRSFALALVLGLLGTWAVSSAALAQDKAAGPPATRPSAAQPAPPAISREDAAKRAEEALAAEEPTSQPIAKGIAPGEDAKIDLLELLLLGGPVMWPILVVSLLALAFGLERILGLRRRRVLPPALIHGLGVLAGQSGGLDPRRAYKLCQEHPSAAGNVIRAMLLKVGRPHTELEAAVKEAESREATKLYSNVRWLALAERVAPLLGLLGTVWGMILSFFATANLPTGANKAQVLAEGIYQALVTTLAGLSVAIPAALLAHYLEGRIQSLFRELDELLLGMMPQLERFEGRLRVHHDDAPAAKPERPLQPDPTPK